jgi:hypothetical protein
VSGHANERESAARRAGAQFSVSRRVSASASHSAGDIARRLQEGAGNALVARFLSSAGTSRASLQRDEHHRMRVAYSAFLHNPDVELTSREKEEVHRAINQLLGPNVEIRTRLWRHYATHDLEKVAAGDLGGNAGETLRGNTKLDARLFGSQRHLLGPIVLHEFVHAGTLSGTGHWDLVQEARAYAVEYYFARRAGSRWRARIAHAQYASDQFSATTGLPFRRTFNVVAALDRVSRGQMDSGPF